MGNAFGRFPRRFHRRLFHGWLGVPHDVRARAPVIQRNPEAVLEALRPSTASSRQVQVVLGQDSSTVRRIEVAVARGVGDVKKRPRRTKSMGRGDRNSLNAHSIRGKQGIAHENRQLEG